MTTKDHPFAIPESPPSRITSFNHNSSFRADDFDLRNTKSESPELISVRDLPLDDIDAVVEQDSALQVSPKNGERATPAQLLQVNGCRALGDEPVEPTSHQKAAARVISDQVSTGALLI